MFVKVLLNAKDATRARAVAVGALVSCGKKKNVKHNKDQVSLISTFAHVCTCLLKSTRVFSLMQLVEK